MSITQTIANQIKIAVEKVASSHKIENTAAFVQDILSELGLTGVTPQEKKKAGSVAGSESGRKRVVSKKMKEGFMALPGATEEKLKEVMKAYKDAAEVDSFDAFARRSLAGDEEPKEEEPKQEKKEKKPRAKKEKSGRFTPNATSRKLFKTIVDESGVENGSELEKELVAHIEGLSDECFASASIQGHMRAFIATKTSPKEEAPEDEDEDLEDFDFEGEMLLKGVTSGKIYQTTEESGDVLIGQAGKGRFKSVKV
jgi:hypothetical protein